MSQEESTPSDPSITRYPSPVRKTALFSSRAEKIDYIATRVEEILSALDIDTQDESMRNTPQRVAKMYVEELFAGVDSKNFPNMTTFKERCVADSEIIILREISISSLCEHHLLPFLGTADIAYIPSKWLIGLSKIHRLVRYFCQRPQLQERLTAQIADSLSIVLDTPHVAVTLSAIHGCISCRGVRNEQSTVKTAVLLGQFKERSPF